MDLRDRQLERAVYLLKASSSRAGKADVSLEERIMKEFDSIRRSRRRLRNSLLMALTLIVASGGFAAAGGATAVKGWITRLELISKNGDKLKLRAVGADGGEIGDITMLGGGPSDQEGPPPGPER
jgi:hypothetical protein